MGKFHRPGPDGRCLGCLKTLEGCDPAMADWFWDCARRADDETHIAFGYRGLEIQQRLFFADRSDLPWPRSKHNRRLAIDPTKPANLSDESDPNTFPAAAALDLFFIDPDGRADWSMVRYRRIWELTKGMGYAIRWLGTSKLKNGRVDGPHFEMMGIV